jgi:hypothetical protein
MQISDLSNEEIAKVAIEANSFFYSGVCEMDCLLRKTAIKLGFNNNACGLNFTCELIFHECYTRGIHQGRN